MDLKSLKNKKICVVGLLINGYKIVRALNGDNLQVTGADDLSEKERNNILSKVPNPDINWITSYKDGDKILDHDLIITSVGYGKFIKALQKAKSKQIPIIWEADFLSDILPGPIVGITGTHGKSTTLHILKKILVAAKIDHQAIGGADRFFPESFQGNKKITLFELSSSKLAESERFHPHIAVLTNLSLAHQERHHNRLEYYAAKVRIFAKQTASDYLVYNSLNLAIKRIIKKQKPQSKTIPFNYGGEVPRGIWRKGKSLIWRLNNKISTFSLKGFGMLGAHNVENLMAAIAVAKLLNVPDATISATIPKFRPLHMRLEPIATLHGVTYYNDCRAVTPAATSWALHTLDKNVILLAGGSFPPGPDYDRFKENLKRHVKFIIIYGETRKKFFDAWGQEVETYLVETLKEAVDLAYQKSERGDSVLLSPTYLPDIRVYPGSFQLGKAFEKWVGDLKDREKTRRAVQWEIDKV